MTLTSDTFACPHCERSFPYLPTLIDRRMRCISCGGHYRLERDGSITALESAEAEQPNPQRIAALGRRLAMTTSQTGHSPARAQGAPTDTRAPGGRQTRSFGSLVGILSLPLALVVLILAGVWLLS